MLLTINIGNTNTTFLGFSNNSQTKSYSLSTNSLNKEKILKEIFLKHQITAIIISSVVPKKLSILLSRLRKITNLSPIIAGKDVKVVMKTSYTKPANLGQDRLIAAYAALSIYGAPSLIIDYGTAVTFNVISRKKIFLGGLILPGIEASLSALSKNSAQLPKLKPGLPQKLIGANTQECILSGVIHGLVFSTDRFIKEIRKIIGEKAPVIATGGNAQLISSLSPAIQKVDLILIHKGLQLLYLDYLVQKTLAL